MAKNTEERKVLVFGHHRSGNHYMCALVNVNFFGRDDYRFFCNGRQHALIRGVPKNKKFIYIYRNFEDVSKSMFAMRARFGLEVDTYEDFLAQRYCDMYTGKIAVNLSVNIMSKQFKDRSSSIFFHNIKRTPKEWHDFHLNHHLPKEGTENLLLVSYDDLKADFDTQIRRVADFLGSDKKDLVNIGEKVGYTPI
jgi:hypothetical protein